MLRWMTVLGIVGFLSGLIGPVFLMPQSNIAPIIGVVFTGPGAAFLGAVIGGVLGFVDLPRRTETRALAATAASTAIVILGALLAGR